MTCPADSNRRVKWETANPQIPIQRRGVVGFPRLQAREDVNLVADGHSVYFLVSAETTSVAS